MRVSTVHSHKSPPTQKVTQKSSNKKNVNNYALDQYLNGTQYSNMNFEDSRKFEVMALKSGMNQMDTQKLLDLVKKYGNNIDANVENSYPFSPQTPNDRDYHNGSTLKTAGLA